MPENINDAGTISGQYVENNNVTHGFIRLPFEAASQTKYQAARGLGGLFFEPRDDGCK